MSFPPPGILNCGVIHGSVLELTFLVYVNTVKIEHPQTLPETYLYFLIILRF